MNELQLTGRLVKICPKESGVSKSNKAWENLTFVIETEDTEYHKLISMVLFGDKISYIDKFNIGDVLTVKFSIESREFNNRYFTNVNAYSITGEETKQNTTGGGTTYASGLSVKEQIMEQKANEPVDEGYDSGLPF